MYVKTRICRWFSGRAALVRGSSCCTRNKGNKTGEALMPRRPRPELSLVIPIYNEDAVLPRIGVRLNELLSAVTDGEVVFVDDGSTDRSREILRNLAAGDPRFRVLALARRFGREHALAAGIDAARGKTLALLDAELEDPPVDAVRKMLAQRADGFDVVLGRRIRSGENGVRRLV